MTELSMGSRKEEEGNVFHGRSGCGRTRGDDFFEPVQFSECQSGEKFKTSADKRQE